MASNEPTMLMKTLPAVLTVQEVAKASIVTVPKRYIRPDQEPPSRLNTKTNFPAVPTIDMNQFFSDESTTNTALQILHTVCAEWGVFQLVNHGISQSLSTRLKNEIGNIFKLPLEEKEKYRVREGSEQGYGSIVHSEDQKLDFSDRFYMITNPHHKRNPSLIAQLPSSFRTTLEEYLKEMQKLAKTILEVMAKALKIDPREMELFEDGLQSFRTSYYPPCSQPELVLGLSPHSDATAITILNQLNGVDGLEIKKDGIWIPVNVVQDALVINTGDFLEMFTNGIYKSVEHRATVNSEEERLSFAMFFTPKAESEIEPFPNFITSDNPSRFHKIRADKYLSDFFFRKRRGKSHLERTMIQSDEATNGST